MASTERLERAVYGVTGVMHRLSEVMGRVFSATVHGLVGLGTSVVWSSRCVGAHLVRLGVHGGRLVLVILAALYSWSFGHGLLAAGERAWYFDSIGVVLCGASLALVGVLLYAVYAVVIDSAPGTGAATPDPRYRDFTVFGTEDESKLHTKMSPLTLATLAFGLVDIAAVITIYVLTNQEYYAHHPIGGVVRLTQAAIVAVLDLIRFISDHT